MRSSVPLLLPSKPASILQLLSVIKQWKWHNWYSKANLWLGKGSLITCNLSYLILTPAHKIKLKFYQGISFALANYPSNHHSIHHSTISTSPSKPSHLPKLPSKSASMKSWFSCTSVALNTACAATVNIVVCNAWALTTSKTTNAWVNVLLDINLMEKNVLKIMIQSFL